MDINQNIEPIILSIETTSIPYSVSVSRGENILHQAQSTERTKLSSTLTLMIQEAVHKSFISLSEITHIAISQGPGSYTGLRVGYSIAKGLCFALQIKLVEICTLNALAFQAHLKYRGQLDFINFPLLHARQNEAFGKIYDSKMNELLSIQSIYLPFDIPHDLNHSKLSLILCGDFDSINQINSTLPIITHPAYSEASYLTPLALQKIKAKEYSNIFQAEPFYLKDPKITAHKKKFL